MFVGGAEEEINFILIYFAKFKLINCFQFFLKNFVEFIALLGFSMFKGLFLYLVSVTV